MDKNQAIPDQEVSLLKEVRLKEEQIEKSLTDSHEKAKRLIEEARLKSQEIVKNSEKSTMEEISKYRESQRLLIKETTEKILSEAQLKIKTIHEQALKNSESALQYILSNILSVQEDKSNPSQDPAK